MIVTDAVLEPTPIMEGSVCDRCGKCAEACPLGAIHADETEEIEICGKKMTVAVIDYDKCRVCKNGACPNRFTPKGKPTASRPSATAPACATSRRRIAPKTALSRPSASATRGR